MSVRGGGEAAMAEFQLTIDGAALIATRYTAFDPPQDASEAGIS